MKQLRLPPSISSEERNELWDRDWVRALTEEEYGALIDYETYWELEKGWPCNRKNRRSAEFKLKRLREQGDQYGSTTQAQ